MLILFKNDRNVRFVLFTKTSSVSVSTLIDFNAMNWPGGVAISYLHRLHHWLITLQEHQSILTNVTVSKDSEIGILMVVYENFFKLISSVSKN